MNRVEVVSPYSGEPIRTFDLTSREEALQALERAHACHRDRAGWLPPHQRISILERAATIIEDRAEDLARQSAREGGKPLSDALIEVNRGVEGIKVAVREIASLGGREIPMSITPSSVNRFAHTYREPRGVVLAISAFNHPFNLIIHQVVPAVATGCPVLIKPAMTTPISCENVVNILYEAGLPEPWCQMLITENEVTEQLVGDPRVSFMTFIGSARVGWHLRSRLAPGSACALEHGGLAPAIVEKSADLDEAVPLLVKGGYYHAGQVCVSVQRIYVERAIAATFVERFVAAVKQLRVGDPLDEATEVGPLILPQEVDRVHEWVTEAVEGGGQLLCGGEKISDSCYAPTVILDPPDDVRLSTEEVFGPVVVIYRHDDQGEAVRRANKPDLFFQASVFTKDLDIALKISRALNGMAVMVNDHTAFRVDWMPFGGHLRSGLGLGGIGYTMAEMSLERMVVFRSAAL
jgi:acyl-CoA reductase-like NAD-dependent aldehyde dehydrogenase